MAAGIPLILVMDEYAQKDGPVQIHPFFIVLLPKIFGKRKNRHPKIPALVHHQGLEPGTP